MKKAAFYLNLTTGPAKVNGYICERPLGGTTIKFGIHKLDGGVYAITELSTGYKALNACRKTIKETERLIDESGFVDKFSLWIDKQGRNYDAIVEAFARDCEAAERKGEVHV
jgi:hypothetical protein